MLLVKEDFANLKQSKDHNFVQCMESIKTKYNVLMKKECILMWQSLKSIYKSVQ